MLLSSIEKKKVKSGTITDKHSTTENSYHAELSNRQRKPKQKCTRKIKNIMGEFSEKCTYRHMRNRVESTC